MGDSNANKSLFMARYTQEDSFTYNNFVTTTGVDFKIKNTEVYGEVRKLYIWDTAGQERFSAMTAQYYRGAHAVFILYNVTSVKSFKIAQTLFQSLEAKNKEIPVILIGEYSSLSGDEPAPRLVPTTDRENFARSKGLKFLECSSLENSNVDEAFSTLAHDAVEVLEPELVEQYVQYLAKLRTATMGILVNNRITTLIHQMN